MLKNPALTEHLETKLDLSPKANVPCAPLATTAKPPIFKNQQDSVIPGISYKTVYSNVMFLMP